MSRKPVFADVERGFTAAALDPSRWPEAMDIVARASSAKGALLLALHAPAEAPPQSASLAPSTEYYFKQGWHRLDERFRGLDILRQRGVLVDFDIFSPEEIERHPYFQDFLARFDLKWFAGVNIEADGGSWCLSLQRAATDEPFSLAEQRRMAGWGQRLSNVALLGMHLAAARLQGALDMLEGLGAAAILLDRRGNALRANQAAARLFCPEFRIRQQRLVIADRAAAARLEAAIGAVAGHGHDAEAAGPLPIPRAAGRPLFARLVGLDRQDSNPFALGKIVLLLTDPDARPTAPAPALARLFGLTPAEARLACRISTGERLADAADDLRITYETARSRLKSVLQKTGTDRQAALVLLLSALTGLG